MALGRFRVCRVVSILLPFLPSGEFNFVLKHLCFVLVHQVLVFSHIFALYPLEWFKRIVLSGRLSSRRFRNYSSVQVCLLPISRFDFQGSSASDGRTQKHQGVSGRKVWG